jgi:peptide/nickel transport system substrate-binding protein
VLDVNPASKVFDNATVRAALRDALDNKTITTEVFGADASPAMNFYPTGMLPNGAVPEDSVYKPSLLASALKSYKGDKVTVGWSQDVADQLVANIVAATLQKDGLNATVEEIPAPSVINQLPTTPRLRPDLLVGDMNPDSTSPDTWARIYNYTNAPVNWQGASVPAADKVLDQAVTASNAKTALKLEIKAATMYRNSNYFDPISDDDDTMVFSKGITGFHSLITYQYVINLADLRR